MIKSFGSFIIVSLAVGILSCDSGQSYVPGQRNNAAAPAAPVNNPTNTQNTQVQSTPAQQTTVQQNPAATSAAPATSDAKLNPAHGMPGHRCDIPVGSPLNAAATVTPATIPAVNSPVSAPLPKAQPQTNAKLNPPHGQPGHDCAIPVGQPLKS